MKDSENKNSDNVDEDSTKEVKSSEGNVFHKFVLGEASSSDIEKLNATEIQKLVNQKNEDGNTPLHLAYKEGKITIANILIALYHANKNILDNQGKAPSAYIHFKPKDRKNDTLEDINKDFKICDLVKDIKETLNKLDTKNESEVKYLNTQVEQLVKKYTNYYSQSQKLCAEKDTISDSAKHKKIITNQIIKLIGVDNKFKDILKGILNKISFNKLFREYKAKEDVRKNIDMNVLKNLKSVELGLGNHSIPSKPKMSKTERFKTFL